MDPERLAQVEEKERQHAAYHEAGHAVLLAAFGERLDYAHVWRNTSGNPDEKAWFGRVSMLAGVERYINMLNGLAGIAAEFLHSEGYGRQGDADAKEVADMFQQEFWDHYDLLDEISPTDRAAMGDEPPAWAFRKVVEVLLNNWQAVATVKEMLLQKGKVAAAEIEPLVNEELPPWMDPKCKPFIFPPSNG